MKRLFTILLAVVLVFSAFALAETAAEPTEERVEGAFLLISRQETDGSTSYALMGPGDGTNVFETFLGKEAEGMRYEEQFEALFAQLRLLVPARSFADGTEVLAFSGSYDGNNAPRLVANLNNETLAEFASLSAAVFATGSFAEAQPTVSGADFTVYMWTLAGAEAYNIEGTSNAGAPICVHCGKIDDGSAAHDTIISRYCKEGHTKCMGDPEHYCDPDDGGCGRTYKCSRSNSHTKCIKCGKLWCYKKHGDHTEAKCGHRYCEIYGEEAEHEKCVACGEYLCNGKDHALEGCGLHHKGDKGDHTPAVCGVKGHYSCDGKVHTPGACGVEGHLNCDGRDHAVAACGNLTHFNCDGQNHGAAACGIAGHFNCDGLAHEKAACGEHYTCAEGYIAEEHAAASCGIAGHYACDGKDHSAASCKANGHYNCDGKAHGTPACGVSGHCTSDGKAHSACPYHLESDTPSSPDYCKGYLCDGQAHAECAYCHCCTAVGTHGDGVCNAAVEP